jgi:hypothetical protein
VRDGGGQWGRSSEYRAHILSAYPFTTLTPSSPRHAAAGLLSAFCLPLSAFCLPLSAFCLLSTAYRPLPTAHCLLPTAYFPLVAIAAHTTNHAALAGM